MEIPADTLSNAEESGVRLECDFRFPIGVESMRITDIRTQIVHLDFRNCILVQVETDEGITGLSETVMKRKTLTIEASILQIKSYLVGKDPTEIETHWECMYRDSFWVGGPMHSTAISAIDCALWDILGKMCGLPVSKLMGGPTRRKAPVYCHSPSGATPAEFAEHVKGCVDRGFRNIKTTLPLFYGAKNGLSTSYSGTNGSIARTWKETEYLPPSVFPRIREFFQAARDAVGPDIGLAVDCHGRLSVKGGYVDLVLNEKHPAVTEEIKAGVAELRKRLVEKK